MAATSAAFSIDLTATPQGATAIQVNVMGPLTGAAAPGVVVAMCIVQPSNTGETGGLVDAVTGSGDASHFAISPTLQGFNIVVGPGGLPNTTHSYQLKATATP